MPSLFRFLTVVAVIAGVIYVILKKGNMTMAITTLSILALFTILGALVQRGRGSAGERGS